MLPLYEAKMIHHYDTRWATYEPDGSTRLMTVDEKAARMPPMPRYWVPESEIDRKLEGRWDKSWFLGWRDICRATDARTVVAAALPRMGYGHKTLLAMPARGRSDLQAVWSSFVFDFVARQKIGGTSLTYFTFMQLAMPAPGTLTVPGLDLGRPTDSWIGSRVDRLNAWVGGSRERGELRAELDALMLHVFGLGREDAAYILDTFPIVKAKDIKEVGEYRTKHLIVSAYDAMADAIASRERYRPPFGSEALP